MKAIQVTQSEKFLTNIQETICYNNRYAKANPDAAAWVVKKNMQLSSYKVGDSYRIDYNSSFSCGESIYQITRVEANGDIFGTCIKNTLCELDESDVM